MFRINKCIALLFLLVFLALTVQPVSAGPASPELLTLTNPDGTRFKARIRGDEFQNWTEAENGYSIVRNRTSKYWEYAEKAPDGAFRNSGVVFTPGATPSTNTPKGLRPDRNTRGEADHNRMIRDRYLERRESASTTGSAGAAMSASATGDWVPVPVSGARNMLIILINFADRSLVTTPSGWNNAIFDTSGDAKSMANYYAQNSYGALTISPAVHSQTANPAGIISVTIADNHPNYGSDGDYTTETTILNHALAQATQYVDFASFDGNGNGTLEQSELSIYFVFAGYEASGSSKTPNVWAHAWGGYPGITAAGKNVNNWALNGELNDSGIQHPMGVIAHEMGHALCGLPDLYDTTYTNAGLGIFSLMASGSWGSDTGESGGTTPVALDAWSRQYLGWSTPVTPSANGTHDIPLPLSSPSSSYKFVDSAVTGTEYFLAENRYPSGWDLGMKNQLGTNWRGGLLILHVDITSGAEGSNDINKYVANAHQGVMAEEATSTDCSLVNGKCWGSANTLFYSGNNNVFTDTSAPNSRFYGGSASGFGVLSISEPEQIMSAQFSIPAVSPPITALLGNGDFESGATGWSTASVSGTSGTWTFVNSGTYPVASPHGGSAMAKFNSYDASSGSRTRLYRSAGLSLSNSYSSVNLNFWMYHDTGWSSYGDQIQVQVSTDGNTWINVGSPLKRSNGTTGWAQSSVDLSSYRGSSSLRIGFLGISKWGNNMYLDDVTVTTK